MLRDDGAEKKREWNLVNNRQQEKIVNQDTDDVRASVSRVWSINPIV
jgi:hypothetical protein